MNLKLKIGSAGVLVVPQGATCVSQTPAVCTAVIAGTALTLTGIKQGTATVMLTYPKDLVLTLNVTVHP